MKTCLTLLAALLATGTTAASAEGEQPLRLRVCLADGSVLMSTSTTSVFSVRTSYADMKVTLKTISSLSLAKDHEMATLNFRNGDKLTGVIKERSIDLQTLVGHITVSFKHLESLYIMAGELPAGLRRGLLLHYSFDADGAPVDQSGRGHDVTLHDAQHTKAGKSRGAFEFDGKKAYLQARSPVRAEPPFTMAFWVKPARAGHPNQYLVSNGGQTGASEGLFAVLVAGRGSSGDLSVQFGVRSWDKRFAGCVFSEPLQVGRWQHVVCSWDGSASVEGLRVVIDGVKGRTSSDAGSVDMFRKPQNLRIGAPSNTLKYFLKGAMDEVMIWDRVLSDTEIRQLYESQAEQ